MWKLFNLWCGIRSANLNNIHRCFFLHTLPTYSQCSMIGAMVVLMNIMYYCIMKSIFPVLSVDRTGMELKRNHCVIIHPSIFYSINLLLEFSHASQRYLINLPHRIGAPRK